MKYIVILGDGMSDEPIEALQGATPLEAARTPMMDSLASRGELGMVQNVPQGMAPGSDVANLSVMGYDPLQCYSGRSPLEALSLNIDMEPGDIAFRCNLDCSGSLAGCPGRLAPVFSTCLSQSPLLHR